MSNGRTAQKAGTDEGLVSPEGYLTYLRTRFFETMTQFDKRPIGKLRDVVYPMYKEADLDFSTSPFSKDQRSDLVTFLRNAQHPLVKVLDEWKTEYNLRESTPKDPWVSRWVVISVLEHWKQSPKEYALRNLLFASHEETVTPDTPPTFIPDPYFNFDQATGLMLGEVDSEAYIDRQVRRLKKELKGFCSTVDTQLAKAGWTRFVDHSIRDVCWTVQYQVLGLPLEKIAEVDNIEPWDKTRLLDPVELDQDPHSFITNFETSSVHKSTVWRAVTKILNTIHLIPRSKRPAR